MIMSLDKKCKHSVRYGQGAKDLGPLTVYVPNEWFAKKGPDPDDPPQVLEFTLEVKE